MRARARARTGVCVCECVCVCVTNHHSQYNSVDLGKQLDLVNRVEFVKQSQLCESCQTESVPDVEGQIALCRLHSPHGKFGSPLPEKAGERWSSFGIKR